ncbi:uncharacterized protein G2W53_018402 [Senna tora]|uniref:Uncharacterized protein n=1 Tax=Senna tora TaxID=362788 RepID=A0A834WNB2_9FABA|nr:uncharacterized protein G2W53_018402 [Senna tora]
MGAAQINNIPGFSRQAEDLEVPALKYDIRLRRRWKRRCIANEMMKHKYRVNSHATRKNVDSCGNASVNTMENSGHMAEEEVDEDYQFFLDNFLSHIDVSSADNVCCSDVDDNRSHKYDDCDAQYKIFLENLREDGNSYIFEFFADNQLFHVKYEGQEEETLNDFVNTEVQCNSVDEDYQLYLNSSRIGDSLAYMSERAIETKYQGSESEEKSAMVRQNLQVPNVATEPPNARQSSDNFHMAKHKCNSAVLRGMVDEDYQLYLNSSRIEGDSLVYVSERATATKHQESESEEKSSMVRQNLQVPNLATEPLNARQSSDNYHVAKHKCNGEELRDMVDEDYQLYLNSSRIEGDSLVYVPERAIATKYQESESEENGSMVRQNLHVPSLATESLNTRQSSDNYHVAKHKCNDEVLRDMVDEDYQLYLNSLRIEGDNLVYMPEMVDEDYQLFLNSLSGVVFMQENGVTEVYEEDNDRSSADSEPIVLEPNQYGNGPFICSKKYDLSWFADERDHRYSFPFNASDPSPYRKGLMENLERPYDQNEYDQLLREASCRRTRERHRETRNGVIKSCPVDGVNKSNLDLYSGKVHMWPRKDRFDLGLMNPVWRYYRRCHVEELQWLKELLRRPSPVRVPVRLKNFSQVVNKKQGTRKTLHYDQLLKGGKMLGAKSEGHCFSDQASLEKIPNYDAQIVLRALLPDNASSHNVVANFLTSKFQVGMRFLHYIVSSCLFNKGGNTSNVSAVEQFAMYCIMTNTKFNIPSLMIERMMRCTRVTNVSLPYASLVTLILEKHKINPHEEARMDRRFDAVEGRFDTMTRRLQALELTETDHTTDIKDFLSHLDNMY